MPQPPLTAMVSYQSADADEAELLHKQLALRGMQVTHDQCTFEAGARIPVEMDRGVATADIFIPLLTPSSLYLNAGPGLPRPAIDSEFLPAMARRRLPRLPTDPIRPVVLPVFKWLGDRNEATDLVATHTGEHVGSLWNPANRVGDDRLSVEEARALASASLNSVVGDEIARRCGTHPIEMVVVSRGTGQAARFLTIDATSVVGGDRRAGEPNGWDDVVRAFRDVETALAASTPRGRA